MRKFQSERGISKPENALLSPLLFLHKVLSTTLGRRFSFHAANSEQDLSPREDAKRKSPTPWMPEKRAKRDAFKFFPLVRAHCLHYLCRGVKTAGGRNCIVPEMPSAIRNDESESSLLPPHTAMSTAHKNTNREIESARAAHLHRDAITGFVSDTLSVTN